MRILGIDPGLQRTGFGLVDVDGQRLAYGASGTISTSEAPRGDLPPGPRAFLPVGWAADDAP